VSSRRSCSCKLVQNTMSLSAGDTLGPYEVVAPIGAGGMGEVYRARDVRLGRDVALKALPTDLAHDLSRRDRFEREARTVAALNHPNIVALHDIGDENGVFFMVTELVEGSTLRDADLSTRKAIGIAAQIADGLAAAHAAGITHRDLKPDNVMVTSDGRAKILDFGLAKVIRKPGAADSTVTQADAGTVMGTAGYMSPEQVRGEEVDARSDIFSFGALLYELLAGRRAFQGATLVETMHAVLKQDPPELPDSVPPGVRDLVGHCLEKKPEQRFQSARDLAYALRAVGGRPVSTSDTLPVVGPPRRGLVWLVPLLLVAAALAGGVAALRWAATLDNGLDPIQLSRFASEPGAKTAPAFAPDGRSVAYLRSSGANTEVVVKSLDALEPVLLASVPGRIQSAISWTPESARVCYNLRGGLWCVGASGGTPQRLAAFGVLTPDGNSALRFDFDTRGAPLGTAGGKMRLYASSPPGSARKPVEAVVPDGGTQILAVSPDSTKVLVTGATDLWVLPLPKGSAKKVPLEQNMRALAASWFPDNRHVLLSESTVRGPGFRMVIADTQGPARRLILPESGTLGSVSLSPDGKRVLYSAGPVDWDIFEYSMDGKRVRAMAASADMDIDPSWSGLGDRFVYSVVSSGRPRVVWTRSADGSGAAIVKGAASALPRYSPDGRRLAYLADDGAIETIPAAGGRPVRIYPPRVGVGVGGPCWSPDGEWLWFGEIGKLRKVPSQGGAAVTVLEPTGPLVDCSPDGLIAHMHQGNLVLASQDGKRIGDLIGRWRNGVPAQFGEGGKVFYYLGDDVRSLIVVDVQTRKVRQIVAFDLPTADTINSFSVHPDGKRALLTVGGQRYDLWMAEGFAQPAKGWKSWFRHWEVPFLPTGGPNRETLE
jgi:serine/threonine protein kinase/Tol biopolymer transport system component